MATHLRAFVFGVLAFVLGACSHADELDSIVSGISKAVPPHCQIVDPANRALLGGGRPGAPGAQTENALAWTGAIHTSVASNTGAKLRLRLFVDGRQQAEHDTGSDEPMFDFEEIMLPEGPHRLELRCDSDGVDAEHTVDVSVDLTPCGIAVIAPQKGQQFTLDDDASAEPGTQILVDANATGDDCEGLRLGRCPLSEDSPAFARADLHVKRPVTLTPDGDQGICIETRDRAANIGQLEVPVSLRDCTGSSDANACGPKCIACGADNLPDHGIATCKADKCAVGCETDYHYELGRCAYRPGCRDLSSACHGDDCCAVDAVSASATRPLEFHRSYDASDNGTGVVGWQSKDSDKVRVSDFYLDRYEVTVTRFRRFVEQYEAWAQPPLSTGWLEGEGAHPEIVNSGLRTVWRDKQTTNPRGVKQALVPQSRADLEARIGSCLPSTYRAAPSDADNRPINCLGFFDAFLFCVWDGGRLPTEAEWNLAAAGAGDQRAYPWSDPASKLDLSPAHAIYDRPEGEGPQPAGSAPDGEGVWKTQDLAGNVWEWVRDVGCDKNDSQACPYLSGGDARLSYVETANNPLALLGDAEPPSFGVDARRFLRGGAYKTNTVGPVMLRTAYRELRHPLFRENDTGVRCARSPSAK